MHIPFLQTGVSPLVLTTVARWAYRSIPMAGETRSQFRRLLRAPRLSIGTLVWFSLATAFRFLFYRGEGYLNTFDYFGTDDVAHSGYMPVGSIQDNFGPSTPFDIIPGPSSQIVSTHNRIVRETLFKNKHAHVLCMTIIEIMSKIRLRVSHAGIVEDVNPVDRDNVFAELEAFAAAAAPELQNWIRAGSQRRVGTNANIRVATARRSNRNGTQLFLCTWCGLVTTTKNNLGSEYHQVFDSRWVFWLW